jgi:methionyl-tRNA synthetase
MSARYITTTLPYVNADPHIGFALELVQADALARVWRLAGDEVFFSTGTDEHGQKILEAAEKAGQKPQEYVDCSVVEVQKLKGALNVSYDAFIRTTSPEHIKAAQEMWRLCNAKGDIYKKTYTGMYCVGCESFKTEKEIVDGHCSIHTNLELQEITEENYFFAFKKYEKVLLEYLRRPDVIVPDWRREEAIAFVTGGLEDFSISREKKRLSWGVPVPGDDSQVMYVWFDALTDYISTLGWPEDKEGTFKKFWQEGTTLQVAGKDQVRFQSLMWQAMLLSAGIKNTDHIFYHGFINSGGQKMSKSVGNVISPFELVKKYGTDATRYILLRHINPMEDSDVTWERLDEWYTANLTNGLGNLVARVMTLAEAYPSPIQFTAEDMMIESSFTDKIEQFHFNEAIDLIWEYVGKGDAYMTEHIPYAKIKSKVPAEKEKAQQDIEKLVRNLTKIASNLIPIMPATAMTILTATLENKKPENLFPRL